MNSATKGYTGGYDLLLEISALTTKTFFNNEEGFCHLVQAEQTIYKVLKSVHSPDTAGAGICAEATANTFLVIRDIFITVFQTKLISAF